MFHSGDSAIFLCLRQKYHPALQRDPSFSEVSIAYFIVEMCKIFSIQYLDKIGTNFFGIAQSKSANTGNALGM